MGVQLPPNPHRLLGWQAGLFRERTYDVGRAGRPQGLRSIPKYVHPIPGLEMPTSPILPPWATIRLRTLDMCMAEKCDGSGKTMTGLW